MAVVVTTAVWPQPDQYTGNTGAFTGQATTAMALPADGYNADAPVYGRPTPRVASIPLSGQAARWLFPATTAVPAASPFTRYPAQP